MSRKNICFRSDNSDFLVQMINRDRYRSLTNDNTNQVCCRSTPTIEKSANCLVFVQS